MKPNVLTLKIPGSYKDVAAYYLDIETEKLTEPVRRWKVTTVGIAKDGIISLVDGDDEMAVLKKAGQLFRANAEVRYSATREFDEMVLRGRFTNARRAHLAKPTYPAMPGVEKLRWVNCKIWKPNGRAKRTLTDTPSIENPKARKDGRWVGALAHNLRDVAEMVLLAGSPDARCEAWLRRVMMKPGFAESLIKKSMP